MRMDPIVAEARVEARSILGFLEMSRTVSGPVSRARTAASPSLPAASLEKKLPRDPLGTSPQLRSVGWAVRRGVYERVKRRRQW